MRPSRQETDCTIDPFRANPIHFLPVWCDLGILSRLYVGSQMAAADGYVRDARRALRWFGCIRVS